MFVNRRNVMIEWGDCDPAGIVFYPRYFAMFDASTAALFSAALGCTKYEMLQRYSIAGIPMVDTGARFLVPSKFGDQIIIESAISRFGKSSFDVTHRVMRGSALAIEAQEKRVWVAHDPDNFEQLRGVAIPQAVIEALSNPN
jgi:4-hydroxybenzoyl-CoA thioesterase